MSVLRLLPSDTDQAALEPGRLWAEWVLEVDGESLPLRGGWVRIDAREDGRLQVAADPRLAPAAWARMTAAPDLPVVLRYRVLRGGQAAIQTRREGRFVSSTLAIFGRPEHELGPRLVAVG